MVGNSAAVQADVFDRRVLEESGIFNARAYRRASGIPPDADPIADYLDRGWRAGIEPGPAFECAWLHP